jgi:hypothetical protein
VQTTKTRGRPPLPINKRTISAPMALRQEQFTCIKLLARIRRVSVSSIAREAVDRYLTEELK